MIYRYSWRSFRVVSHIVNGQCLTCQPFLCYQW